MVLRYINVMSAANVTLPPSTVANGTAGAAAAPASGTAANNSGSSNGSGSSSGSAATNGTASTADSSSGGGGTSKWIWIGAACGAGAIVLGVCGESPAALPVAGCSEGGWLWMFAMLRCGADREA